ncbi:MAG: DoxX family protein [Ilumatobacteraceae bacterium]|jgi:putative oxidoreductase
MSNAIFVIGRILAVLVFINSGLGHLTDKNMVGYAQFKKIPSAALAVRISGVLLLAGAAGIILGIWGDLAAILSALLVLIMSITMHNFWTLEDPQAKQVDMIMFMKNLAMIGGLLVIAWAYSNGGGGNIIDPVWGAAG